MSACYAFAFPKPHTTSFKLLSSSTVGYIDDSIFYKLDFSTGKAEALHHPEGRTYQAFTSLHKRGITVLADYGKQSNLYFFFSGDSSKNFQIKNVCQLYILQIQMSLDGKYIAVACGSPSFKIILINVQDRKILGGSQSFIDIKGRQDSLIQISFNPTNRKIMSLAFQDSLQLYEIKDCLQMKETGVECGITIIKRQEVKDCRLQASIWDQLGNLYLAAENRLWVWSSETGKEVVAYDIEQQGPQNLVRSLILTQKHIIVFYSNGRAEWLMKYYPQLLDQDSTVKPFQLDRYYQGQKRAVHALYDHHFSRILLAYDDGFMGVLNLPAEKYPNEQDQQADPSKKSKQAKQIEAQQSCIGPYHRSRIILIHQITDTSLVITVSVNGRVILWSGKERKQKGYFDVQGGYIFSADINSKHNVLAVSKDNGIVQFYSISSFENPFVFKEFKLTRNAPLGQIVFSSSGQELAVLSKFENRIYYLLTSLAMPFEVLGYVSLSHSPINIAWHISQKTTIKPKHQLLLVCIGYGVLVINGPAPVPTKKRGVELNLPSQIYALRTDLDQHLVSSLPSGEILTTGADKWIKKYRQPQELLAKVDFKSKSPIPPPLQQIEAHDLKITCWNRSADYLVSAGANGSVQIRDFNNFGQFKEHQVAGWKEEGIGYVAASKNGGVYAGGIGGCFQVYQNGEPLTDQVKLQQASFKKLPKERQTKYFEVMIEEDYLERMKDAFSGKKKVQLEKLEKIRSELQDLIIENQKHDQLERLNRDELTVDLQSRAKMDQQSKEKCLQIREESRLKILKNEVLTKKLKQITWDRMNIHLRAVNGLKNNFIVHNYQIRKISKQEKRILNIIFDLRRAQKKQRKRRDPDLNYDFYCNKNVVNGGFIQPLIFGSMSSAEKKQEKKDDKNKKKKEEDLAATAVEQTQQIFNEQQWSLLYNSFELYTDNAKRNQIVMMKHMIIRIKETFNKEFEKIMKQRQTQGDLINDKNKRIQEICEELKRANQIIRPRKNILESNDAVLEVRPQEIPFKRYLSREQREKVERERLKEEERLRKLAEDDSSQRALQGMMSGTLQEKKTSVLEVMIQREKWMDKPAEEMSQEEKVKMRQYEQRRQKAQQEKERIVKKLEAELRKLKMQIDDIMQKYDQKLFGLVKRKLEYDYRIEEQQLYCTRLFLTMSTVKEQENKQVQLLDRLERSKDKLQKFQQEMEHIVLQEQEIQKAKENKHAALDARRLGDIESKIKTIEKSIFEEYQSNHKKRKEMEEKLLQAQPQYHNLLVPLDPLKETESKYLAAQKARDFSFFNNEIKILQQTYQIPEGSLFQILENRFNIRKEEADLQNKLKTLKDTLYIFQQRQKESDSDLRKEQEELQFINSYLESIESDLQIEIRIKQGQVELNNERPVPDLDEALLIGKSEIDDKNAKIIVNANEKITVMKQIKTCKIDVTEETLNLQRKQELINKLNSMIKEIQMLKVKKEMQVALAKKDTKINENQIKSLKEQIEKVRKEGQKRITHFQKKIEKVAAEIETIKKENKQLETQKWNLDATVKQREKIKQMMVGENGGGNQEAKEKFEQIAINRKLFDKAKQQTEEIELLREQLSKLKAKTFANFSNATR